MSTSHAPSTNRSEKHMKVQEARHINEEHGDALFADLDEVEPTSESAPSNTLITDEAVGAVPTLESLDAIRPKPRQPKYQSERAKNSRFKSKPEVSDEEKQWDKTKALVMSSFSRNQLVLLAKEAGLRAKWTSLKKEKIASRLMVHRFQMQDPQHKRWLEGLEAADRKSQFFDFQPAELFLLLSRGSEKVRQAAQEARVRIQPGGPSPDKQSEPPALGFYVHGKTQGIEQMLQWTADFKQTVQTRKEEIVLLDSANDSSDVSHHLPMELSQSISRHSKCFLSLESLEKGKLSVKLSYIDPQDADRAVLMLRQVQAGIMQPTDSIGAAAYADNLESLRQYSMLPSASEPDSWIKQAEDIMRLSKTDLAFRVGHVPDHDAYTISSATGLPDMKLTGWQSSREVALEEPFQRLAELATEKHTETRQMCAEHKATLGHILFNGNVLTFADDNASEAELLQKLQDPLAAPLPGVWPIEHLTNWAREFRTRFGTEASRFLPTTFFRSKSSFEIDVWLDRQGWELMGDHPDEMTERVVLTYQQDVVDSNSKPQLEICLQASGTAKEGEAKDWVLQTARWITGAEAPMMMPERSVDLRLSSRVWTSLTDSDLFQIQSALLPYMQKTLTGASEPVQDNDIEAAQDMSAAPAPTIAERSFSLPPAQLLLGDAGPLVLVNAEKALIQMYRQRALRKPEKREREAQKVAEAALHPKKSAESTSAVEADAEPMPAASLEAESSSEALAVSPESDLSSEALAVSPESDLSSEAPAVSSGSDSSNETPAVSLEDTSALEAESESTPPTSLEDGSSSESLTASIGDDISGEMPAVSPENGAPSETPAASLADDAPSETPAASLADDAPSETPAASLADDVSSETPAASPEQPDLQTKASSAYLVREIVQDPITEATRESLSLVWPPTPSQSAPSWRSTVAKIETLIDKYNKMVR